MMRRLSLPAFRLAPLLLPLVVAAATAEASTIRGVLINHTGADISSVNFNVVPAGSLVPPVIGKDPQTGEDLTGTPLTIDANPSGLDANNVSVALLGKKNGDQQLRVLFGQTLTKGPDGKLQIIPLPGANGAPPQPFANNGMFSFTLTSSDPTLKALELDPALASQGISYYALSSNTGTPSGNPPGVGVSSGDIDSGGGTNVPEPTSLALWAALATLCGGLTRWRRRAMPAA